MPHSSLTVIWAKIVSDVDQQQHQGIKAQALYLEMHVSGRYFFNMFYLKKVCYNIYCITKEKKNKLISGLRYAENKTNGNQRTGHFEIDL